ncbi:hypothetical protein SAMN05443580_101195 [Variovorax sp. OV084]|jgi:hypothetical protein|nr:hypothetical protein SAMN05443580_101195 [Variovorax sp. OV084]
MPVVAEPGAGRKKPAARRAGLEKVAVYRSDQMLKSWREPRSFVSES